MKTIQILIAFLILTSHLGAQQCDPPPTGLVSWWRAEGNPNDLVGGNNGTSFGNLLYTNGEVGQAFVFDNSTSYVSVPASPSLNIGATGSGLTIECWIKPIFTGLAMPLVEWDSSSTDGLLLWEESSQQLIANLVDTAGNNHVITSANNLLNSTNFQHVALTYDKTSGAAVLYCNGNVVATNNLGVFTPQTTYSMNIGRRTGEPVGLNSTFHGLLDELSLYNRALSSSEIAAINNAGSAGKCISPQFFQTATGTAIISFGFVVSVNINNGGYGYTNTPMVRLVGGGGGGAGATAVVSNGVITAITITNNGSGYTSAPLVFIDPPYVTNPVLGIAPMSFLSFSNLTVGGAYQLQEFLGWYWSNQPASFTASNVIYTQMVTGAVGGGSYRLALNPVPAQAFATPVVSYGYVVHATITAGGSGYVSSPAVNIVGGGGTNATAVSQISGGVVTNILITSPGTGYTGTPILKIGQPPAAAVSPTVQPVMRLDAAFLAPYHNYQIQFMPDLFSSWGNVNGGLFSPTAVTNSQYIFITNNIGFFRLQYLP